MRFPPASHSETEVNAWGSKQVLQMMSTLPRILGGTLFPYGSTMLLTLKSLGPAQSIPELSISSLVITTAGNMVTHQVGLAFQPL